MYLLKINTMLTAIYLGPWVIRLQSIIGDRTVETREDQFIENHGVRI